MGTEMGWTFDTTPSTSLEWANIATWWTTEAERNEFWAIVIPSHVSGKEVSEISGQSIVNRGGNLAVIESFEEGRIKASDGTVELSANTTTLEASQELITAVTDAASTGTTSGYLPMPPGVQFAYDATQVEGSPLVGHVAYYDSDKTWISTDTENAASGDFTTPENCAFIRYDLIAVATGTFQVNEIQLNRGSTANTYAPPLDSGLVLGFETAQRLPNANGEYLVGDWSDVVIANDHLSIDDSGAQDSTISFTPINSGIHTFAARSLESNAETIQAILNSVSASAIAGNEANPWSVESVELVGGTAYTFEVQGDTDGTEFQCIIQEGEYTQTEVASRGYSIYTPVALWASGHTSDRLYQQGSDVFLEENVKLVSGAYVGMPEIDTTSTITGDDSDFDTDTGNWTDFSGGVFTGVVGDWSGGAGTGIGKITYDTGGGWCGVSLAGVLTIGQKVTIRFQAKLLTGVSFSSYVGDGQDYTKGGSYTPTGTETWFETTFIAGHADLYLNANASAGQVVLIDNVTANGYNIQEASVPTTRNLTAEGLVVSGQLNQPTTEGQNHQLIEGDSLVTVTHNIGIGGAVDAIREVLQATAMKSEIKNSKFISITATSDSAGTGNMVYEFEDIPDCPHSFEHIDGNDSFKKGTNVSDIILMPNFIIFVKSAGVGAGEWLGSVTVVACDPPAIYTGDPS